MAKYGVFIRIDIEAGSADEAREKVEGTLNYGSVGGQEDIEGWEIEDVEEA